MNQPITTALRLARHPVNDLERYELGSTLIPHLQPGENVDTGALRVLADRVEWLEKEAEQCRVMLHDVAAGRVDSRVKQENDVAQADNRMLLDQVDKLRAERVRLCSMLDQCQSSNRSLAGQVARLTAEAEEMQSVMREAVGRVCCINGDISELRLALREARAENGRQAATIAAMMAGVARVVTIHTGKGDNALFRDWMESQPFSSGHEFRPDAWVFSGEQSAPPLRLEVGKTYVRRDGGQETINFHDDRGMFFPSAPFKAASGKLYYADGLCRPGHWSHADLVALAPTIDPASPHP